MKATGMKIGFTEHVVRNVAGAGHHIAGRLAGGGRQANSQPIAIYYAQVAGVARPRRFGKSGGGTRGVQSNMQFINIVLYEGIIQEGGHGRDPIHGFDGRIPNRPGAAGSRHDFIQETQMGSRPRRHFTHRKGIH